VLAGGQPSIILNWLAAFIKRQRFDDLLQGFFEKNMVQDTNTTWYDRVPKVEIHLHLEGAIPIPALWRLVEKYGGDPDIPDLAALKKRFIFRDFPHFIETWIWKNQFLREYEDFTYIAQAVAQDLLSQNIRYAEVFYSPPDFAHHGLQTQELTRAIRTGLDRVKDIQVALIADLVRDNGPQKCEMILRDVAEVIELGVIGIGIGGSEHSHPPEPFQKVFDQARKYGFFTSAHAGEAAGAESIWGAVRTLKVDRIGHGTRAWEDPLLLDFLAEEQIPIEMCPVSNLRTGVVGTIEEHPIRDFYQYGLFLTVNTDDPKMFNNSLAGEYQILVDQLGFSQDEIQSLILNAIQASWLSVDKKTSLCQSFLADPCWMFS
jgi:adenosine deaminase